MDYQELVDEVIRELKVYLAKEKQLPQRKHIKIKHINKKLALIGELEREENDVLSSYYQITRATDDITQSDVILIADMSIFMMSALALGCGHTKENEAIITALLEGKTIYMLEGNMQYRNYRKSAHQNLYTLYSDYEKRVIQYGIKPVTDIHDMLIQESMKRSKYQGEPQRTMKKMHVAEANGYIEDLTGVKLLTESELMKLDSYVSSVQLRKGCIITPSARDYLKDHGIFIEIV